MLMMSIVKTLEKKISFYFQRWLGLPCSYSSEVLWELWTPVVVKKSQDAGSKVPSSMLANGNPQTVDRYWHAKQAAV